MNASPFEQMMKELFPGIRFVDCTPPPVRPLEEIPDAQLIELGTRAGKEWDESGNHHSQPSGHYYDIFEDCVIEAQHRGLRHDFY